MSDLSGIFNTGGGAVRREAKNATAARQGNASNLVMAADQWYNDPSREAQTQGFMGALRGQLGDATQRGFKDLARGTKFRTAKQGLIGGSQDASRQKRNLESLFTEQQGNEAQVQDAGNKMRTHDFGTRQSLIDQAYGVADVGQSAARRNSMNDAQGPDWATLAYGAGKNIAGGIAKRQQNQAFMDAMRGSGGGSSVRGGVNPDWSLNTGGLW